MACVQSGFNPRTHEGCDTISFIFTSFFSSFNPRTHEGCDLTSFVQTEGMTCFNPRTHEGCDFQFELHCLLSVVSIHAPTRGATTISPFSYISVLVSIHAPTRGATADTADSSTQSGVSIHAPTRGATISLKSIQWKLKFQSTHPRGVRHLP